VIENESKNLVREYEEAIILLSSCLVLLNAEKKTMTMTDTMRMLDQAFSALVRFSVKSYNRIREQNDNFASLVAAKLNEPNDWVTVEEVVESGFTGLVQGDNFQMYSATIPGLLKYIKVNDVIDFSTMLKDLIEE
jgi:hypothetical protein